MEIPFDPYDFFGYLASGLLVVLGMDLLFGFPHVLGSDLKPFDTAAVLLAVYVAGQLVAGPAKTVLEDFFVGRILGRPNVTLVAEARPFLWRFVFPGFFTPLPEATRRAVLKVAAPSGIVKGGEGLFLYARYRPEILANERLMKKLDAFINKYGFSRNLAFASLVVGVALLAKGYWFGLEKLDRYGLALLAVGLLLFYRYLKFFRQYSYELFNTFAGLKGD